MNNVSESRQHATRPVVIIVAALLLLACAAGVVVWMSSGPSVLTAGHQWALYPATGESPEPDASSAQEKLAFEGNVKVFTLLYTESLRGGGENREAVCHVLVDLPQKAILRVTGGGGTSGEGYDNYRNATIVVPSKGEEPLEIPIELRYRFSDHTLQVRSNPDSDGGMSLVATNPGNVYVVRLQDDGTFDWRYHDEHISHELGTADVERLLATMKDGKEG